MVFQDQARDGFATSADYGWCHTDRTDTGKDGKRIKKRAAGRERKDYFLDKKNRQYTEVFFQNFSLPMPTDDMIYRGNSQDLLFLNDLGLVIRTGPVDIVDMIHPCILQPLYWMPFDNTDHAIAIHPGIQLTKAVCDRKQKDYFEEKRRKLVAYMHKTKQLTKDAVNPHNFGDIDNNLVILDIGDYYFGTKWKINKEHKKAIYQSFINEGQTMSMAIRNTMSELYSRTPEFNKWISAYDYHQPLREQIDEALNEPDILFRHEVLKNFYQRCRDLVKAPQDGLALYSPWTGKPEDNISKTRPLSPPHPA